MSVTVTLETVGNVDHGQDPTQPLYGVPNLKAKCASVTQAQEACKNFIEEHNLGAGNWTGGEVCDESGGVVGRISYNGRFWAKTKNLGDKEFL